jgi:O-antigen/teichoic acid export membrane protein
MAWYARLASSSAIIFASRILGAGGIFLAQLLIARFWGADILGEYLLFIAASNLIAVAMPLGFQTIGTYFAAEYRAKGERQLLWRFASRAYGHVAVVAALVYAVGATLAATMGPSGEFLAQFWTQVVLLAFGVAVVFVNGALLVGMRRPFAGFLADLLGRPMLVLSAFAIVMALGFETKAGFDGLLWGLSVGFLAVAAGHFAVTMVTIAKVSATTTEIRPAQNRRWWRFALPWVLISLATDFFFDIDLIVLSGLLSREDLAIFGVCARIFALAAFGVTAVYAMTMPDMFEAEARSDRDEFHRKVGDANLVAVALALVLFVGVLIGGRFALMLFGPAFTAGSIPLLILCLALLVRALLGPASLVLSIHDRPYASLPAVGCGLASLVLLNHWLVPGMGLMGAALAALISISLWSAALWATAFFRAGVDVSVWPRLKQLADRSAKTAASTGL